MEFLPPDTPRLNLPVLIGDPSVPTANTYTTWGRSVIPVRDPGVPINQLPSIGPLDPLVIWKTQPSVRKVVGFIARNVASVPWHAYLRVDDNDRKRLADSPAETLLSKPRRFVTGYKLWRDVAIDACLYDVWAVAVIDGKLERISPRLLQLGVDVLGNVETVKLAVQGEVIDLTDVPVALGTGWSPFNGAGVSPLLTLSNILAEQLHAVQWRNALWTNGPKMSGVLKRPIEAPAWETQKRDRFLQSWRTWRDSDAGGTPVLEDGMEYDQLDQVNPADAKDIEGRQLTDAEVASAFHVPPELVGARPGNFASIAAFRQMLFGPVLGPLLQEFQQAVNAEIVPALDARDGVYVELDRESAMNGSFAEQAQVLSTAVGGPWLLRNEARGKQNLPAIDGGDELVTPLNVTTGGQASPRDSGSQNTDANAEPDADTAPGAERKALHKAARFTVSKATSPDTVEGLQAAIADLYRRQTADLKAGDKVDPEAFHKAWDALAAEAVHAHLLDAAAGSAQATLAQLKAPADAWSIDGMRGYVKAMADTVGGQVTKSAAERINADDWPADPEQPDSGPSHAGLLAGLEVVAATWAVSALADAAGFGSYDGASAGGAGTKTWITDGPNPRPSHAAMNGETVALDDVFSNGCKWPGDSTGDADETVNCTCGVQYTN